MAGRALDNLAQDRDK